MIAEFSTEPSPGDPIPGRWTRLRITQTESSGYVCEKVRGPAPMESRTATVEDLASARAFFGGGWIVKELFAKIDAKRYPRFPR